MSDFYSKSFQNNFTIKTKQNKISVAKLALHLKMYFKTKFLKVLKYLLCVYTLCDGPYNFMLLLQSSKIFRLKTGLSFSACYHAKVAFLE